MQDPHHGRRRKYQPLAAYLAAQTADELTLTFTQIEAIIGAPLPPIAFTQRFWSNSRSHRAYAPVWLDAGWRVAQAHPREDRITFRREQDTHANAPLAH